MASTSGGKGRAYDAQTAAVDWVAGPATNHFYARVAEAEAAHVSALAKVEKQAGHLKAAKDSAAEAKTEVTRAQKALAESEREAS